MFHWPQITVLFLAFGEIGFVVAMNGKEKEGNYSIITGVVSASVWLFLLYKGGFFS